jgi:hypothetical protein
MRSSTNRAIFLSLGPLLVLAGATAVAIKPDLISPIVDTFDASITNKLGSASGVERTSWNMVGLRAFFETFGLGAGIGSVRTSSFLVGVLANLGISRACSWSTARRDQGSPTMSHASMRRPPAPDASPSLSHLRCHHLRWISAYISSSWPVWPARPSFIAGCLPTWSLQMSSKTLCRRLVAPSLLECGAISPSLARYMHTGPSSGSVQYRNASCSI